VLALLALLALRTAALFLTLGLLIARSLLPGLAGCLIVAGGWLLSLGRILARLAAGGCRSVIAIALPASRSCPLTGLLAGCLTGLLAGCLSGLAVSRFTAGVRLTTTLLLASRATFCGTTISARTALPLPCSTLA
jgi:hypothetical protein